MLMTFLTLELTREFMAELVFEAALGRMVEVVVVGLAGLFWRKLTKAVEAFVRKIGRAIKALVILVVTLWNGRVFPFLRERVGRLFGAGRKEGQHCSRYPLLPLWTATC